MLENNEAMDLNKIVAKAKANDEKAAAELLKRYEGLLRGASMQRHVLTIQEEAYSEARFRFYEAIMNFDPALGIPFSGFAKYKVYAGVHTLFRRKLRIWQNEISYSAENEDRSEGEREICASALASKEDISETTALISDFYQALSLLPPRQKAAAEEVILHGATMTRAAADLKVSVQAVSKNYAKAIAAIRKNMGIECADADKKVRNKTKAKKKIRGQSRR